MPISYPGGGVLAEHAAVREAVGLFDVTHLGKISVVGRGAAEFVNSCFTADLARITPGRVQYTLCCADDGGVLDDLIAYLISSDEVFCVPNAANTATVATQLAAAAPAAITVTDLHREYAVLAIQGPRSAEVIAAMGLAVAGGLDYMTFVDTDYGGELVRVGRTGYTGELGYELMPRWEQAPALWSALRTAAEKFGGRVCGLGARDTLRTEMGYPLNGQDTGPQISPVQAGASWAVGWTKPAFWGREALLAERDRGPARRLRGLRATQRGIPRPHMMVRSTAGAPLGETTSGTFSPTLGTGIALALLDPAARPGDVVEIDVRGRALACEIVKLPFVPSHVR
jgi:aminomethyltransferase